MNATNAPRASQLNSVNRVIAVDIKIVILLVRMFVKLGNIFLSINRN